MYFSERNKLKPQKEIVLGNLDRTCKNRLWNCIYDIYRRNGYDSLEIKKSLNYVLDKVGEKYTYSSLLGSLFGQTVEDGVKRLEQVWENSEWYCEFDIIETILEKKLMLLILMMKHQYHNCLIQYLKKKSLVIE